MEAYGEELILDLHKCNPKTFTRESIDRFFEHLCSLMKVERDDFYFWDDEGLPPEECQTDPRTKGVTAIQFILTSNITVHTLDELGKVFLNIFCCDSFDAKAVERISAEWFQGEVVQSTILRRF